MPILEARREAWVDEAACAQSARRLAACPAVRGAFIELHGALGAGKTTFTRHLLRALGVTGHVKSPTYAVVESYQVPGGGEPFEVWHFDFYRFEDPQEFEDAGFREVFAGPGLKLAEWPERADGLLPPFDLRIDIVLGDETADEATARQVTWQAGTPLGLGLLP